MHLLAPTRIDGIANGKHAFSDYQIWDSHGSDYYDGSWDVMLRSLVDHHWSLLKDGSTTFLWNVSNSLRNYRRHIPEDCNLHSVTELPSLCRMNTALNDSFVGTVLYSKSVVLWSWKIINKCTHFRNLKYYLWSSPPIWHFLLCTRGSQKVPRMVV